MGWLDGIVNLAGLQSLQAGSDLAIDRLGILQPWALPKPLRAHAAQIVAERFRKGELSFEDEHNAALLKLGVYYANAEAANSRELQQIVMATIDSLREQVGDRISPSISLEVLSVTGSGPNLAVPPPLPSLGVVHPEEVAIETFDELYEDLIYSYDRGEISLEEYGQQLRELLHQEVAVLIEKRLAAHPAFET